MSVMETIRARPRMTSAVAVVVLLIALMRILFQLFGGPTNATGRNQAFYSDDDGKSWFIDDSRKGPPFDHHGRPAYLAVVCRTAGGKLFVASLQEYSEGTKAKIEAAHDSAEADHWRLASMDAKKPGETKWLSPSGPPGSPERVAYQKALEPVCPDGSATWTYVSPADPDNRAQ